MRLTAIVALCLSAPAYAGVTYFPGASGWSTLMFEDLYPLQGDLDFNDAVVQTHWRIEDTHGQIDRLVLAVSVQALGASQCNGLSLRLPVAPSQIDAAYRIEGSPGGAPWGAPEPLTIGSSSGDAVIVLAEDLTALCDAQGFVNTDPTRPATACAPLMFDVLFDAADPPGATLASQVPHDVFLTRCGDPGWEVHRAAYPPTSAFDLELSGTDVTGAAPFRLRSGTTIPNLPFVLHVGEGTDPGDEVFAWPEERARIDQSHPQIVAFAAGTGGLTWYRTGLDPDAVFLPPNAPAVAASVKVEPCAPPLVLPNDLCGVTTDGLLAWFDAHDPASWSGSGGTWFDLSGLGHHASGAGHMPTGVLGVDNSYLRFTEAADARLVAGGLASHPFDALTVEVWVNNTGGDYRAVVNTGPGTGIGWDVRFGREDYYGGANNGTRLYMTPGDQGQRVQVFADRNTWGLYGMTFDGSTLTTYKNGEIFGQTAYTGAVPVSAYGPTIGRYADGSVAEDLVNPLSVVRIWDRALTEREMAHDYAVEAERFTLVPGPLVHLDMRRRDSWPGSGTTWFDLSGNDHDASGAGHMPGASEDASTPYFVFTESPDTWFSIASLAGHDFGTDVTVEVWLQNTGGDYRAVVNADPGGIDLRFGRENYSGGANNGTVLRATPVHGGALAAMPAALGVWGHYAFTYDGGAVRTYVDGDPWSSAAQTGAIPVTASPIRIGRYGDPNEDLVNPLAVVRIYDRALTDVEIGHNFDVERAGFDR